MSNDPIIFSGSNPRGRFGTSLANLGDIDRDGNEGRGALFLTCMYTCSVIFGGRGVREGGDRGSSPLTCPPPPPSPEMKSIYMHIHSCMNTK